MLKKLVLAAVPEQVNIPILICLEKRLFAKYGLEVVHRVVPEGTGKMLDLLESREVDVALTVTDGFIAGKASGGRKVRLVGTFVESPLVWAVACSNRALTASSLKSLNDLSPSKLLRKCRFGISRLGSGSHTMGIYAAKQYLNTDKDSLEFTVANNFQGLRDGTHRGDFDAFMWETFTTKPFFDSGELRKLGEVATPWTAFSFVCSTTVGADAAREIDDSIKNALFPALSEGVEDFLRGAQQEAVVDRICREHGHTPTDALAWLASCKYAINQDHPPFAVSRDVTARSVRVLQEVGLVPLGFAVEELWSHDNRAICLV